MVAESLTTICKNFFEIDEKPVIALLGVGTRLHVSQKILSIWLPSSSLFHASS